MQLIKYFCLYALIFILIILNLKETHIKMNDKNNDKKLMDQNHVFIRINQIESLTNRYFELNLS